jgi:DNA-binding NarL/FixJ family response regulator
MLRIVLADRQENVRSALRLLLEQEDGMSIAAEVDNARSLLDAALSTQANLILLDWNLPGADTAQLITDLRATDPGIHIIALSGRPEVAASALCAGCNAFVSKGDPPETLLAALEAVQQAAG